MLARFLQFEFEKKQFGVPLASPADFNVACSCRNQFVAGLEYGMRNLLPASSTACALRLAPTRTGYP
ncbi:hypothetical protein O6W96_14185 [Sphingomonas faeni]